MEKRMQKLARKLHKASLEAEECCKYQKEIDECRKSAKLLKKDNDELRKKLKQLTDKEKEYEAVIAREKDQQERLDECKLRYTAANRTVEKLKEDMNSLREHFRVKEMDYAASLAEKRDRTCELEKRLKESISRCTTAKRREEKLKKENKSLREPFSVKETEYDASMYGRKRILIERLSRLRFEMNIPYQEDAERERNNDISEQQYSTNVAEMYKHLYDNAWSDAYENLELQGFRENKIIEILLQILKNVMEFCHSQSEQQNNNLQRALLLSEKKADSELSPAILKQVEICKKESSSVTVEHLFEIHHPPMQIDFESNARGRPFNENVYNHYTKSGNYINFIIWPPLLLCKNGPVLVKGVAQGISLTSTPVSETAFRRSQSFGKIPVVKYELMENHCTRWSSNPFLSR